MTERTVAAARRLLVVALFLLGFGEVSSGGGESGVRAALDAGRAFALTAGDTPAQFVVEQDRAAKATAAGLGGGEDDRAATAVPTAPVVEPGGLPHAPLASAGTPQPHIGFSSRAPPART